MVADRSSRVAFKSSGGWLVAGGDESVDVDCGGGVLKELPIVLIWATFLATLKRLLSQIFNVFKYLCHSF